MTRAAAQLREPGGPAALARSSEALLTLFEQLTESYEHSMQVLVG